MEKEIENWIKTGEIQKTDTTAASRFLLAEIIGLFFLRAINDPYVRQNWQDKDFLQQISDYFVDGLKLRWNSLVPGIRRMLKIILKNLLRRKTRTLLTVLGISIGAAAIIGLGTMADGFQAGYNNMMTGSKADMVLSQPDSYDISMSAVDEEIGG